MTAKKMVVMPSDLADKNLREMQPHSGESNNSGAKTDQAGEKSLIFDIQPSILWFRQLLTLFLSFPMKRLQEIFHHQ